MDTLISAMSTICDSFSRRTYEPKPTTSVKINGQEIDFDRIVIVGRAGEIIVYGNICMVSRRHLHVLARRDGNVWIRDNCSKIGTFVNGQQLEIDEWFKLLPDDKVTLGGALPLEISR